MSDEKLTILYVDDEEINLFLFKSIFEEKYNVITALSGKIGLSELESSDGKIDVVISDMNMPEMNGLEFINAARGKFDNIVYFILTGYNYNDEIDAAIKSKIVQKFFSKPFDFDSISAAIQQEV